MKKTIITRKSRIAATRSVLLLALLLPLLSCGQKEKVIPKEETGEPNVVPAELQRYRDAREVFRSWVTLFQRPRETTDAFPLLSSASRRRLTRMGIDDAQEFTDWIQREEQLGHAPFLYEFSRFDILDIDVRDSLRAVVTASFIVHRHQSTFESVSSFFLIREQGKWKVPFAESGNFESSWWQKEKNFLTRLQDEGMATYEGNAIGLSFMYPMTWDLTADVPLEFPSRPRHPGVEVQYVDPATLSPAAIIRVAVLPPPAVVPASADAGPSSSAGGAITDSSQTITVLESIPVHLEQPFPMTGTMQVLQQAGSGRRILYLTVVADHAEYSQFAGTFKTIRQSIILNKENNP